MNSTELNLLVEVVKAGSFTKAAEHLGTQKSWLSRRISALESELGVRLLERTTRALSLTEVGQEVYQRAIAVLESIDAIEQVTQQLVSKPMGELKLSCGVEFGMLAVSRWINGFIAANPEVEVNADFSNRITDLVHEGFDLAIRVGELPDSSMVARKLGDIEYGLFASPQYLQNAKALNKEQDLQQHQTLVFTGGRGHTLWKTSNDYSFDASKKAKLKANNSFTLRDACIAGLGIAKLPTLVVTRALKEGRLLPVLAHCEFAKVSVSALFPSANYLTPKVRAFIDHAIEHFDANQA